jgi:UMP-CMP kinase
LNHTGPGSGKGTQCERLSAKYHYEHLSAGDLLRAERKKDTEMARQINSCISEGRLVPSEITTGLLAAAIAASESACFIIDGFPRSESGPAPGLLLATC